MTEADRGPEKGPEQGPERGADNDRRRARGAAIAAVATAGILLAGSLGFVLLQLRAPADRFAECREVRVAGGVTFGGPFTLISETGETVTDTDVIDRPALIYFGYTFCPDVCPLDVVRNAEAIDLLEERGLEVRPVFITIDPARDTPEVVGAFTDGMHENMLGLTGSPEAIKAALSAYGGTASKMDDDPEYYLMAHSTLTYLAMPGEGVVALFTRTLGPEEMSEKIACFIERA